MPGRRRKDLQQPSRPCERLATIPRVKTNVDGNLPLKFPTREQAFYAGVVIVSVVLCLGFWAALGYLLSLQG
jgi:hypothetical protein